MRDMHREIHKSMATMETNNGEIFFIRNFNCSRILAGRIFSSFNNFHGNLKQLTIQTRYHQPSSVKSLLKLSGSLVWQFTSISC